MKIEIVGRAKDDARFTELRTDVNYDIIDEDGDCLAQGIQGGDAMRHAWPEGSRAFETMCTEECRDGECVCEPVEFAC